VLASTLEIVRIAFLTLSVLTLGLVLNLAVASGLEYHAAQAQAFNTFRDQLAAGTAPIGPLGGDHRLLAPGAPMALLEIPSIGVKDVVGEGTTGQVLMSGPGHLRSTVFPGGVGTSVIFGRAEAYGGPFAHISQLRAGALIKVTTGVGTSLFRVTDVRHAGSVVPNLAAGRGRLTLATATGSSFIPTGVVWVDARLTSRPLPAAAPVSGVVSAAERPLATDTAGLWALALWLVVLALVLGGAVWAWHRRGHVQAWIIFTAPVVLVAYFVADHVALLLPNLM
jgi:LPXTG-site transpeptidase (sortase) family protein